MRKAAFELPFNCALIAAALVGPPCTASAEPGHPCAIVTSDSERLACYDRTFGHPANVPRPAPTAPGPSTAESATRGMIENIESTVTAVSRRRTGEFVYTLANGQVWEQADADSAGWLRDGAAVTIKRAALGSYKLVSGSVATRVRRVR